MYIFCVFPAGDLFISNVVSGIVVIADGKVNCLLTGSVNQSFFKGFEVKT